MDRWTGLLPERGPPRVVPADPTRAALTHHLVGVSGLVGQQAVAELGVVLVGVEQRVRSVSPGRLSYGDRGCQSAVVGLAGELQHPARHRDGSPVAASPLTAGWDLFR